MHRRPEDENLIQYQQGHSGLHCQEMPAPLFHNKSFQTMKLNYFFSILGGFLFHWREAIPLQQHLAMTRTKAAITFYGLPSHRQNVCIIFHLTLLPRSYTNMPFSSPNTRSWIHKKSYKRKKGPEEAAFEWPGPTNKTVKMHTSPTWDMLHSGGLGVCHPMQENSCSEIASEAILEIKV